jgi:hydrogenase/urease accessory protein HupE
MALPLFAHDPGLSTVNVRLRRDALDMVLVLSVRDAGLLMNLDLQRYVQSTPLELKACEVGLAARAAQALEVTIDDLPAKANVAKCSFDKNGNAALHFTVPGRPVAALRIQSRWLALLPPGHRQFLSIQNAKGDQVAEQLLSANSNCATIQFARTDSATAEPSAGSSLVDFLAMGFKHILTGYDHLLFIIALVLAATTFWDLVKVVTAFTLAHMVTLTLSVLNLVRLPSSVVEPMIAGSIVLVALTNVFWPKRSRGWLRLATAFFFGLFHGLGFAGGLLSAIDGSAGLQIFIAVAAFSFGVELGHQLVVLPVFFGLKLARATRGDDRNRERFALAALRGGSLLVSMAGTFYLIAALK